MKIARTTAFALLCLLGAALVLLGFGSLDHPVTDQQIAVFMRTDRYIKWSEGKQSVTAKELYPALQQWRDSNIGFAARLSIGTGIVTLLAGGFLYLTARPASKQTGKPAGPSSVS